MCYTLNYFLHGILVYVSNNLTFIHLAAIASCISFIWSAARDETNKCSFSIVIFKQIIR